MGWLFWNLRVRPNDGRPLLGGIDFTQLQQQTNAANRPNQYNPFGSTQQTYNPVTGQWQPVPH